MKKAVVLLLCTVILICGCSKNTPAPAPSSSDEVGASSAVIGTFEFDSFEMPKETLCITESDTNSDYDLESACVIECNNGFDADGDGAFINDKVCTIASPGVYVMSGKITDGQIIVNADKDAKIQIVLNGLTLTNKDGSAIFIKSAGKVVITLAEGTKNKLTDAKSYSSDSGNSDAVIFSKEDLTFNGTGKLTVNGRYAHGIVSKDALIIAGGTYKISSVKSGICGKDCTIISSAKFDIASGTDAIKSDNSDDESKGFVYIFGGEFVIDSGNDGISASQNLMISGGNFSIKTAGGTDSTADGVSSSANANSGERPNGFDTMPQDGNSNKTEESAKALKATSAVCVSDGSFDIDSRDDAVHSNGSVQITGGSFKIKSDDDAVHADVDLVIDGGEFNVSSCYEGLEAIRILINDGDIDITSSDDGINAYSTTKTEERAPDESLTNDTCVYIKGGRINIYAQGDGIDSNGAIEISGGMITVCTSNGGNAALDYDSYGLISGGVAVLCGQNDMALNFGSKSTQYTFMCNMDSVESGTRISCTDKEGNIIVSYVPTCSFSSVVISSPALAENVDYNICSGGYIEPASDEILITDGTLTDFSNLGTIRLTKIASTFNSNRG